MTHRQIKIPPSLPIEFADDSPPPWDQEEADGLVGLTVLAGLTYLARDGKTVTSQVQCWGRITKAEPTGISFICEGKTWLGQTITLPPWIQKYQAANRGQYSLRSTGEIVEDPDLLTSWTISEEKES